MLVTNGDRRIAASTPSGPLSVDKAMGYQWEQSSEEIKVYINLANVATVEAHTGHSCFDCHMCTADGQDYQLCVNGLYDELEPQPTVRISAKRVTLRLRKQEAAMWPTLRR